MNTTTLSPYATPDSSAGVRRTKQRMKRHLLLLTAVCLLVCVLIGMGVSYGRYRSGAMARIDFASRRLDQLWLWELAVPAAEGEEPVAEGQNTAPTEPLALRDGVWASTEDGVRTLRFRLTNGETEKTVAEADILADVLLDAGQGFEDPEWLTVILYTTNEKNEELRYLGVPTQIAEGSTLYSRFGEGWCYRFYPLTEQNTVEMDTAPLCWEFPGGEYTAREAELRITGTVSEKCPVRLRIVEMPKET